MAVTYENALTGRIVEIPDDDASRIADLDRSKRWQRVEVKDQALPEPESEDDEDVDDESDDQPKRRGRPKLPRDEHGNIIRE